MGIGRGQGSGTGGEGGQAGEGSLRGEIVGVGIGFEGLTWVSVSVDVSARVSVASSDIYPDSEGSRWLL